MYLVEITCFLSFSNKNHAESSIDFVKNLILNPKHVKFDQKSEIGHVRAVGRRSAPVGSGQRAGRGRRAAGGGRRRVSGRAGVGRAGGCAGGRGRKRNIFDNVFFFEMCFEFVLANMKLFEFVEAFSGKIRVKPRQMP